MNKKVGELLKETRMIKGKSLDQVSDALKISKPYLKALEEGNWDVFPAEVYIKGFLKNYAKYLGIEEDKASSIYRRERYVDEEVRVLDHGQKDIKDLNLRNFHLTKNKIAVFAAIFGLIAVLLFSAYQIFIAQQKPLLELTDPLVAQANTGEEIKYDTDDNEITLEGKVGVGDQLFVNGDQVFTFGLSDFQISDLELQDGENRIVIQSRNQFGIKSEIILLVIKS